MIDGNASAHIPFFAVSRFFNVSMTVLLLDSSCPLTCGFLGVGVNNVMLHSSHKCFVLSLINCDPLSHITSDGTPNLQIMLVYIKEITSLFRTCLKEPASIHLEK